MRYYEYRQMRKQAGIADSFVRSDLSKALTQSRIAEGAKSAINQVFKNKRPFIQPRINGPAEPAIKNNILKNIKTRPKQVRVSQSTNQRMRNDMQDMVKGSPFHSKLLRNSGF